MIGSILKMKLFVLLAVLYLAAPQLVAVAHAANPCVLPDSGIGGSGQIAQGEGIGGAGLMPGSGGIGGTGAVAASGGTGGGIGGTGIVGVITGFGSICVNGIRIHYDATTPVQELGKAAGSKRLAIGQLVAVEAAGVGGEVRARHIEVVSAVIGPVSEIDHGRGTLRVLGQNVRLTTGTALTNRDIKIGDPVQVSGLRESNGTIVATRIESAAPGLAAVTGTVGQMDARGFRMHGLSVEATIKISGGNGLESGRVARVTGTWDGNRLRAEEVKMKPVIPFEGRVSELSIEGYARLDARTNRIRVGDAEIYLSRGTRVEGGATSKLDDVRVRVRAHIDAERRIVADRIDLDRNPRDQRDGHRSSGQTGDSDDKEKSGSRRVRDNGSDERNESHSEKSGRSKDKGDRELRPDIQRTERSTHPERQKRPERQERPERPELPERPDHD